MTMMTTTTMSTGSDDDSNDDAFFSLSLPHSLKQMYNINGLQKVCDILLENPSWTIAHLMANFNLVEYISHPKVLDLIDQEDHTTKMTPFQVSISMEYA